MARKVVEVRIDADGRDKGKVFEIKEMSATDGEWWAYGALHALSLAGVDVPEPVKDAGMAGLATVMYGAVGSILRIPPPALKPLLDQMLPCIKYKPIDRMHPDLPARPLIEEDIEEITTWFQLRWEWINLHTSFLLAGAPSGSEESAASSSSPTATSRN